MHSGSGFSPTCRILDRNTRRNLNQNSTKRLKSRPALGKAELNTTSEDQTLHLEKRSLQTNGVSTLVNESITYLNLIISKPSFIQNPTFIFNFRKPNLKTSTNTTLVLTFITGSLTPPIGFCLKWDGHTDLSLVGPTQQCKTFEVPFGTLACQSHFSQNLYRFLLYR